MSRSREHLARHPGKAQPEIIFHLAAQPLVMQSLRDPVATFQSNVLGVVNLLDAVRHLPSLRAIVVVTSDKCYLRPDRRCAEGDPLGGHDPYSASKACAEIVTEAYRCLLLPAGRRRRPGYRPRRQRHRRRRLLARPPAAGPDPRLRRRPACRPCAIRTGVRPWQHVLDALAGYLVLAERLAVNPASFSTAWNFGPEPGCGLDRGAGRRCRRERFGAGAWHAAASDLAIEVPMLLLSSEQAQRWLGWRPRLRPRMRSPGPSTATARCCSKATRAGWSTRSMPSRRLQPASASGPPSRPFARALPMPTPEPADIPIFVLCGGLGSRLGDISAMRPKPMLDIGEKPMLVHIMACYGRFGFRRFVLCTGHRSEVISDYFANFAALNSDYTVDLAGRRSATTSRSACRRGR